MSLSQENILEDISHEINLHFYDSDSEENSQVLKGKLEAFVSPDELKWRKKLIYEQYPYEAFTQYIRNPQHKAQDLRTPQILQQSIHYLISKILDLCEEKKYPSKQTIGYLENRFRAIRRQYHIQNIFNVDSYFKMIQVSVIAIYYTEDASELWTTLSTVFEHYIKKQGIEKDLNNERKMCIVKYLLLVAIKYSQYEKILVSLSDQIRQIQEIQQVINLCNSIKLRRFHSYFQYLRKANFLDSCVLLLFCNEMREVAIRSFAKAQLNMQIEFLRQFLYFDSNQSLLLYLQIIGYNTKPYKTKLKDNNDENFFIGLKIPQTQIKSLVKSIQICKRVKQKRNGSQLSAIILNKE